MTTSIRRSDESLYMEEDYRDDILQYMRIMDVSIFVILRCQ